MLADTWLAELGIKMQVAVRFDAFLPLRDLAHTFHAEMIRLPELIGEIC